MSDAPHRPIKSFVIRGGRITDAQQAALARLAPRFEIPYEPVPLDLDGIFGRAAPRVVEIGFGSGENLIAVSAAHPQRDYLGIEVHPPGVGRALLAIETRQLTNVRLIRHDAVEVLRDQLAPGSLDEVLVLFPDPWHKKRHHKRRLIQPAFVALVADRLKEAGCFRLATDWTPYAEQMLEVFNACPRFRNLSPGGTFVPRPAERTVTRFERRGEKLGHDVHDLAFERL